MTTLRLYDGNATAATTTPTTPPPDPAARLYDAPAAPVPATGTTPGEQLYGHSLVRQRVDRLTADLWSTIGTSAAERAQEAQLWEAIALETHLPDTLIMDLATASIANRKASARVEGGLDDDPDAATTALRQQVVAWQQEARERLVSTYGAQRAEELVARVNKFAARFPKLAARLVDRGLGSRPEIGEAFAAFVHSNGIR